MQRFHRFILLLLLMSMTTGCSYMKNRGHDALDIIDIGFTFSKRPQFAAYYSFVPIVPIGYGNVDGQYVGIGTGRPYLWSPHVQRSYGAILWGEEELSFHLSQGEAAELSAEGRDDELTFHRLGAIGVAQGPFPDTDYLISCPHYLHIGWVGVVVTPRYLQIVDFLLGWTGLDIARDDGRDSKPLVRKPDRRN